MHLDSQHSGTATSSRSAWATQEVPGQLESKALPQNKAEERQRQQARLWADAEEAPWPSTFSLSVM